MKSFKTQIVVFLSLLFTVISCKTKKVESEKIKQIEKESISRHLDSLSIVKLNSVFNLEAKQSEFKNTFILKSLNLLDSTGQAVPFHFKHFIDGKLNEEIYLKGGTLTNEKESTQKATSKKENVNTKEIKRIEVDVGLKKEKESLKLTNTKQLDVNGFQFGFYLWLLLIVIILITIRYINKKYNILEKFKSILNITEV